MKVLTVFESPAPHDIIEIAVLRAGGSIVRANGYEAARAVLSHDPPHWVVCERTLTDGSWKDLLEYESVRAGSTLLIVTSRTADAALWAEVLNLGGHDVLPQPFDEREVMRILRLRGRAPQAL